MRTGRDSDTSRERTTSISPRTPRRSGSASRAARPRQSTTKPSPAAGASRRRSGSARCGRFRVSASAGERPARIEMRLLRKEQRAAEAAGKVGLERGDASPSTPFEAFRALGEARQFAASRGWRHDQAAVAHRARKALASTSRSSAHRASRRWAPSVARSHHGASMPPAIHEQLPSPSVRRDRSPRQRRRARRKRAPGKSRDARAECD